MQYLYNNCVLGGSEKIVFSDLYTDDNKLSYSILLKTSEFQDVAYCQVNHNENVGTINFDISENHAQDALGLKWTKSPAGAIVAYTYNAEVKVDHYERYKIDGYSFNGTLLTTDIIKIYKQQKVVYQYIF